MSFCIHCGKTLAERVPPGDNKVRLVCGCCGHVSYVNPKVVVGTLPIVEGRVLLLRRAIEPQVGLWTYPGGFLEMRETAEEGACREAREELGVTIGGLRLHGVYTRTGVGIVTIVYLASLLAGEPGPSPEALEAAYFAPEEIPWADLAFPTTEWALKDWTATLS